jgi:hypothetical protein
MLLGKGRSTLFAARRDGVDDGLRVAFGRIDKGVRRDCGGTKYPELEWLAIRKRWCGRGIPRLVPRAQVGIWLTLGDPPCGCD